MNTSERNASLQVLRSAVGPFSNDPHLLVTLVELLRQSVGGLAEACVVRRLTVSPAAMLRDPSVAAAITTLHPTHRTLRAVYAVLVAPYPLAAEHLNTIRLLVQHDPYHQHAETALPELLLRLHRTHALDVEGLLLPMLKIITRSSTLLTVLLVLGVCAPAAACERASGMLALGRSPRVKCLLRLLPCLCDQSNALQIAMLEREWRATCATKARVRRSVVRDLQWICRHTRSTLYKTYLKMAIASCCVSDCEILVPLLADDRANDRNRLLQAFTTCKAKRVEASAIATLQHVEGS